MINLPLSASLVSEEATDMMLVTQVLEGKLDAFEKIMRRYNQRLYRVSRAIIKHDDIASDILQDAYISAFNSLNTFKGPNGFGRWLTKIVINEALMHNRKTGNKDALFDDINDASVENEIFQSTPIEINAPEDHTANMQLRTLLEQAIDKLPSHFATVFIMRKVEDYSVKEVSDALGIEEATVKTRYFRAKQLLQKNLDQQFSQASLSVFEFAGHRCDNIVRNVMSRLQA